MLAVLATYRRAGSLLLSPVWHEYRAGGFNLCTSLGDVKGRHVLRGPRAVFGGGGNPAVAASSSARRRPSPKLASQGRFDASRSVTSARRRTARTRMPPPTTSSFPSSPGGCGRGTSLTWGLPPPETERRRHSVAQSSTFARRPVRLDSNAAITIARLARLS